MTTTAAQLVAEARASVEALTPEAFAQSALDPHAVVIDLREDSERATGVIPGAVHIPRGMLEFRADPTSTYHDERLDPSRRVLLHCASGGRSALAAVCLRQLGYSNVAHLDGGITAWSAAGMPVEM